MTLGQQRGQLGDCLTRLDAQLMRAVEAAKHARCVEAAILGHDLIAGQQAASYLAESHSQAALSEPESAG